MQCKHVFTVSVRHDNTAGGTWWVHWVVAKYHNQNLAISHWNLFYVISTNVTIIEQIEINLHLFKPFWDVSRWMTARQHIVKSSYKPPNPGNILASALSYIRVKIWNRAKVCPSALYSSQIHFIWCLMFHFVKLVLTQLNLMSISILWLQNKNISASKGTKCQFCNVSPALTDDI